VAPEVKEKMIEAYVKQMRKTFQKEYSDWKMVYGEVPQETQMSQHQVRHYRSQLLAPDHAPDCP
jgi:hypothetical protein